MRLRHVLVVEDSAEDVETVEDAAWQSGMLQAISAHGLGSVLLLA